MRFKFLTTLFFLLAFLTAQHSWAYHLREQISNFKKQELAEEKKAEKSFRNFTNLFKSECLYMRKFLGKRLNVEKCSNVFYSYVITSAQTAQLVSTGNPCVMCKNDDDRCYYFRKNTIMALWKDIFKLQIAVSDIYLRYYFNLGKYTNPVQCYYMWQADKKVIFSSQKLSDFIAFVLKDIVLPTRENLDGLNTANLFSVMSFSAPFLNASLEKRMRQIHVSSGLNLSFVRNFLVWKGKILYHLTDPKYTDYSDDSALILGLYSSAFEYIQSPQILEITVKNFLISQLKRKYQ